MSRSPELENMLNKLMPEREQRLKEHKCVTCGNELKIKPDPEHLGYFINNEFRDSLSVREFQISGMCQKCQDLVFGK
jgi:hypothetical protein